MVYRKENYVNWDPVDETVLANDQVIDGKRLEIKAVVQEKNLINGFNITKFSSELLDSLDHLDKWPNKVSNAKTGLENHLAVK